MASPLLGVIREEAETLVLLLILVVLLEAVPSPCRRDAGRRCRVTLGVLPDNVQVLHEGAVQCFLRNLRVDLGRSRIPAGALPADIAHPPYVNDSSASPGKSSASRCQTGRVLGFGGNEKGKAGLPLTEWRQANLGGGSRGQQEESDDGCRNCDWEKFGLEQGRAEPWRAIKGCPLLAL